MFISKSKKSPFYQLTYDVNGKRTTISTKTKNSKEAYSFLENFQIQKEQPNKQNNCLLLSNFKDEYIEFARSVKSKKYLISISSSFKQLIVFCGDIPLNEINIRILDKFIVRLCYLRIYIHFIWNHIFPSEPNLRSTFSRGAVPWPTKFEIHSNFLALTIDDTDCRPQNFPRKLKQNHPAPS